MFQKIKKHLFLLEELIKRDFDRKHKGSFFSAPWSVINSLLTLLDRTMKGGVFGVTESGISFF